MATLLIYDIPHDGLRAKVVVAEAQAPEVGGADQPGNVWSAWIQLEGEESRVEAGTHVGGEPS